MRLLLTLTTLFNCSHGNFNFFVDKEEFHRITGATLSQVYLVRDGVVNTYALGHVMTIPYHINYLDFKWQATGKRPVHYEVVIEFSDFFALLQPSANVSMVGRLPGVLETVRVHLPCSNRITTQVPIIIRFTFNVKTSKNTKSQKHHHGNNITEIKVKRNKICVLQEELIRDHHTNSNATSAPPPYLIQAEGNLSNGQHKPSYLLASLLGACVTTASIVSIAFFICLKRRLRTIDATKGVENNNGNGNTNTNTAESYSLSSHDNLNLKEDVDSPALLLRRKIQFFNSGDNSNYGTGNYGQNQQQKINPNLQNASLNVKGSDVSPYAYVQIVRNPNAEWYPPSTHHTYANTMNPAFGSYGNASLTTSMSSVVQVDGFQCGKHLGKERGVVERFL